ncbi:dihydropteroate synthase [Streptomyces sp. SL13]|uniref:Dihydropteroate synthase n=1 Tax=Streptantibioticus silvisoli TaxID=2705255 RepID=A0AA90H434_9ACTN|nr:dihydropteroate synthase [Streptantibioticus silvisoli]MDI5973059.1 dihydropteroate synthase [Streptantibioticus silvisoli]
MGLRLGGRHYGDEEFLVMAVVNRTRDSFFDQGATFSEEAALAAVDQAVADGADIIDIGGISAGELKEYVGVEEEIARVAAFAREVKRRHPGTAVSVDTWRHEVAEAVCSAGADLINDSWGGADPLTAVVAAEWGAGLLCAHVGGQAVRTDPKRVAYDDVMADVLDRTLALAERAVALGVPRECVIIDPAHDFGKVTVHSLEVTRRLREMTGTGWPVLVAVSNKDFIGETLDLPVERRLAGTLATLAVCAWEGARIFRVHQVAEARAVLDEVRALKFPDAAARSDR